MDLRELGLTDIQDRILELFAMGYGPATIGKKLNRASSTINTTLYRIKVKIDMEHSTFEDFRVAMIARKKAIDMEYDRICGGGPGEDVLTRRP